MTKNNSDKQSESRRSAINAQMKKLSEERVSPVTKPNISGAASASECTGLTPAPPESDAQFRSYQELSSTEIPKKRKKTL